MNSPLSFDVCVRGAGAVGSSLALALAGSGFRVALVGGGGRRAAASVPTSTSPTQTPATPLAIAPDVRAYALNARAVDLLQRLRVWDALAADARCRVLEMQVHGDRGGHLVFTAWQQREAELAWIVDAAALEAALAEALRYAGGVQQLDAEPADCELRVLCEGARSDSRDAVGARFVRRPYGHSAIATRLVCDQPHGGVAWQWFRSPDILALLPFDRPQVGHAYALVWSVPAEQAQRLAVLDDAAFEAALNEAVAAAVSEVPGAAHPGTLRLGGPRAVWPLTLARADRWCGPGWVLAGDAAHQVHPLAGHGLNLGLADVAALARVLIEARREEPWRSPGDERVLRRYERERAWDTAAMATTTDGLWQLFRSDPPLLRELRNRGMTLLNGLPPLKRWLTAQARDAR